MTRFQRTTEQQAQDELLALRLHRGDIGASEALREQQQRYGVCADATGGAGGAGCALPVVGQCDDCGLLLCLVCLTQHEVRGCPWRLRTVEADPPRLRALR